VLSSRQAWRGHPRQPRGDLFWLLHGDLIYSGSHDLSSGRGIDRDDTCRRPCFRSSNRDPSAQTLQHRPRNGAHHQHDGGHPDLRASPTLGTYGAAPWDLPLRFATSRQRLCSPGDQAFPNPIWVVDYWRSKV
jgi:hypothetical protein